LFVSRDLVDEDRSLLAQRFVLQRAGADRPRQFAVAPLVGKVVLQLRLELLPKHRRVPRHRRLVVGADQLPDQLAAVGVAGSAAAGHERACQLPGRGELGIRPSRRKDACAVGVNQHARDRGGAVQPAPHEVVLAP
jgi:hypothetical protein